MIDKHPVRDGLPPMTERIAALPVDKRGFPIPYFVDYLPDGTPEHRSMDPRKLAICVKHRRCWICGEPLGRFQAFVIGPMCCINRIAAEPPSHRDCAEWAVKGCPFLSRPHAHRRPMQAINGVDPARPPGNMIERNPGVSCVWVSLGYETFRQDHGVLFEIGEPAALSFWSEGRPATKAEVRESIDTGLPVLQKACDTESQPAVARTNLDRAVARFERMLATLRWPA